LISLPFVFVLYLHPNVSKQRLTELQIIVSNEIKKANPNLSKVEITHLGNFDYGVGYYFYKSKVSFNTLNTQAFILKDQKIELKNNAKTTIIIKWGVSLDSNRKWMLKRIWIEM